MRFSEHSVPKRILAREKELIQLIEEIQMRPIRNDRDKRNFNRKVIGYKKGLDAICGQVSNRLNGGILKN